MLTALATPVHRGSGNPFPPCTSRVETCYSSSSVPLPPRTLTPCVPSLPVSELPGSPFTLLHSSTRHHVYHCGLLPFPCTYTSTPLQGSWDPHDTTSFVPDIQSCSFPWDLLAERNLERRKKIVSTLKRSQKNNPTFPRIWRKRTSKLLLLWL